MTIFQLPTNPADPDINVDVGQEDLEPLLDELEALAETRYGREAETAAGGIRQGGAVDLARIPDGHVSAIVRALDHLRNAGKASPELLRVRDAMISGGSGITYAVREPDGRESTWFSYSGPYERDDRIVAGPIGAAVVVAVLVRDDGSTLLVCA